MWIEGRSWNSPIRAPSRNWNIINAIGIHVGIFDGIYLRLGSSWVFYVVVCEGRCEREGFEPHICRGVASFLLLIELDRIVWAATEQWARTYTWNMLLMDLIAGVTVGFTTIPQSIGYAAVAGLPLQVRTFAKAELEKKNDSTVNSARNTLAIHKRYRLFCFDKGLLLSRIYEWAEITWIMWKKMDWITQYGLYSAFVGPFLYIFLGTVKEISLGPTAIMALMT